MHPFEPGTYEATPTLRAMLDAAVAFGLTRQEAWRTFNAALVGPHEGPTADDYLDDIAGALARAILAKQRRLLGPRAA